MLQRSAAELQQKRADCADMGNASQGVHVAVLHHSAASYVTLGHASARGVEKGMKQVPILHPSNHSMLLSWKARAVAVHHVVVDHVAGIHPVLSLAFVHLAYSMEGT